MREKKKKKTKQAKIGFFTYFPSRKNTTTFCRLYKRQNIQHLNRFYKITEMRHSLTGSAMMR